MRSTLAFLLISFMVAAPVTVRAQIKDAYPVKPIRLVVTFVPGGTTDIQARLLNDKLAPRLGQQIVLDHRGGAGGNIGMEVVARSPADGYTLVITVIGTWAVNPHLYKLPYDVQKDFAPIIHFGTTPGVLVVHPSVPARSVKDLIALARKRPGELTYGTAGVGSFTHISAELFGVMTGTKMTHVPYKGSGAVTIDLIGGHLQLSFSSAVPAMPQIQSGRFRALATTGAKRSRATPELPTVAEAGLPGFETGAWYMLLAPAGTPSAVIAKLHAEAVKAIHLADVTSRLEGEGVEIVGSTPEQAIQYIQAQLVRWDRVVKAAGIKAE